MEPTSQAPPVCTRNTLVHEQSTKDASAESEVLVGNSSASNDAGAQPVSPTAKASETEEPAKAFAADKAKQSAKASTAGGEQLEEEQLNNVDLFGSEGSAKHKDELSEEHKISLFDEQLGESVDR